MGLELSGVLHNIPIGEYLTGWNALKSFLIKGFSLSFTWETPVCWLITKSYKILLLIQSVLTIQSWPQVNTINLLFSLCSTGGASPQSWELNHPTNELAFHLLRIPHSGSNPTINANTIVQKTLLKGISSPSNSVAGFAPDPEPQTLPLCWFVEPLTLDAQCPSIFWFGFFFHSGAAFSSAPSHSLVDSSGEKLYMFFFAFSFPLDSSFILIRQQPRVVGSIWTRRELLFT